MQTILSDGTRCQFGPLGHNELAERQVRSGIEGMLYREVATVAADSRETILS